MSKLLAALNGDNSSEVTAFMDFLSTPVDSLEDKNVNTCLLDLILLGSNVIAETAADSEYGKATFYRLLNGHILEVAAISGSTGSQYFLYTQEVFDKAQQIFEEEDE